MFYNTLGFQIHSKCYCNCSICCMSCESTSKEALPLGLIKDIIKQAMSQHHIKHISFSGGDPFLRYSDLLQALDYAKSNGFETSCFTNALWCNEYEKTKDYLKRLENSGLDILRISLDHQHDRYLNINRYKNLLEALKETKIKSYINVGILNTPDDKSFELLNELKEYILNHEIIIFPFMRLGKAEKMPQEMFFCSINKYDLRCPRNPILGIRADGSVYACDMCPNNITPVGNVYQNSLHDIINKTRLDKFHRLVIKKGLRWIVEKIEDYDVLVPQKFVAACEFCKWVNDRPELLTKIYKEERL